MTGPAPAGTTGLFQNPARRFFSDTTGNGVWNAGNILYTFGAAGDTPVTGAWG
ncbi:MAG: hypothetical protein LUO98_02900 [Methanoregula sp.]|nr:hypothetical protein [Methanoregula sp.]